MAKKGGLIQKLNMVRAKTLPCFKKIKCTPKAIDKISRLFLHPFCVSTVDLKKFIQNKPVKLATLSRYIITAFPNTISYYAKKRNKILIDQEDILECFALDHTEGIAENKIENIYSPSYALAHILTLCKLVNIREQQKNRVADLEYQYGIKKTIFKNVFVPPDLKVIKGQNVFHHFGVVVDCANNANLISLSKKLKAKQDRLEYLAKISKAIPARIDFGKPGMYPFDLTHCIIKKNQQQDQSQKMEPHGFTAVVPSNTLRGGIPRSSIEKQFQSFPRETRLCIHLRVNTHSLLRRGIKINLNPQKRIPFSR